MKKYLLLMPVLGLFCAPALAGSSQPETVVELFTSQGCSSCPPANEFVNGMATADNILALTYSVTYWDYLGWKDTFGQPEFTKRQKAYGKAFDEMNIYTPQLILNGAAHSPRFGQEDVKTATLIPDPVNHRVFLQDERLSLTWGQSEDQTYLVSLVEYVPGPQSVKVDAGENHGRVLTLSNVVTQVKNLGKIIPEEGTVLPTKIAPKEGCSYAVLLHDTENMSIRAAVTYSTD